MQELITPIRDTSKIRGFSFLGLGYKKEASPNPTQDIFGAKNGPKLPYFQEKQVEIAICRPS
jgi:hypothetical protein